MTRLPPARWTLLWIVTAVLVIPVSPGVFGAVPSPAAAPPTFTTVSYPSSVDGWSLSFAEFLPSGFQPARTYPLAVYLHGMMATGARWAEGGVPSDLLGMMSRPDSQGAVARGLVANASASGFILIVLNTRTGAGFYANTPCGGPQAQDVMDAIALERAVRHVGPVFLIGFSMGSIGALSLAAEHPGTFRGIAIAGTNTDRFAGHAWREYAASLGASWAAPSIAVSLQSTCGIGPGQGNATVDAIFVAQSVARLHPQALAGTRIWVAAGGYDNRVPNNARTFAFLQVNNTFVNSTCLTFYSEPANCTTTFWSLHTQHPGAYAFRYVYERTAGHSIAQFSPSDIFAWFRGQVPWGFYTSPTVPPTVFVPNPHPGR